MAGHGRFLAGSKRPTVRVLLVLDRLQGCCKAAETAHSTQTVPTSPQHLFRILITEVPSPNRSHMQPHLKMSRLVKRWVSNNCYLVGCAMVTMLLTPSNNPSHWLLLRIDIHGLWLRLDQSLRLY